MTRRTTRSTVAWRLLALLVALAAIAAGCGDPLADTRGSSGKQPYSDVDPSLVTSTTAPTVAGDPAATVTTAPPPTAPTTTAPITTTTSAEEQERRDFIAAGATACREIFGGLAAPGPGYDRETGLQYMRDVRAAFGQLADRLGGLAAPDEATQAHLGVAVAAIRQTSATMGTLIDLAAGGQQDAYLAALADFETVLFEGGNALIAAGLGRCAIG